jgi:hypothetical protein
MSPRELEQGVAWFADQFYSLPSIFDRLLCKSPVGIYSLLFGDVIHGVLHD